MEYLVLVEVDEAGLATALFLYDLEDARAVQREAWARWTAIDPAAEELTRALGEMMDAGNARDGARHRAQLSDDLVVLDQCVDTRTPAGKLLYQVLGAVAEFERDLIKERTLDGLERARRAGTQLGRPSVLDRQTRSRIQRLQRSGHTVREIAEKVDLSVGTVHKALHL